MLNVTQRAKDKRDKERLSYSQHVNKSIFLAAF